MGDIDSDDDKDRLPWKVQRANTIAVDFLVRAGYDGEQLHAMFKPKESQGGEASHTAKDEGMPVAAVKGKECGAMSHGPQWISSDPA